MDPASAAVWRLSDVCSLARRASWRFNGVVADCSENAIPTEFPRGWLIPATTSERQGYLGRELPCPHRVWQPVSSQRQCAV